MSDSTQGWIERAAERAVDGLVNTGFDVAMRINRRRFWPRLTEAATGPAEAQRTVLRRIVEQNRSTTFGRQHGFDRIESSTDYRRAVPVQDYESLRPLIEEQERTGKRNLTTDQPVIYAQTSGTSGEPKYIPMTADGVARTSRAQRIFASALHAGTDMFAGKIVGIGSPAIEGQLPGGTPFGSASGMVYEQMPSVVRRKYVIGPEVLSIDEPDLRYRTIAARCMAASDVTGVATANPSTLLRLRSVMVERWEELVAEIASSDRSRAEELNRLGERHGDNVGYAHIWERLAAITTWTGGSAGFALSALEPHLHPSTKIVELGYSASEVRGTIGIDPTTNLCVPLIDDNYYEFVARDDRESAGDGGASDRFVGLDELQQGEQYYVYVTTFDGLYRYDMNDIVEVTGRFAATPTLAFVQKGRGVTNITGEKLSESQVITAVEAALQPTDTPLTFFVALADEEAANYRLYVERASHSSADQADPSTADAFEVRLAADVDRRLGEANIEYRSKRSSGRLGPMIGIEVRAGTADAYRAACVAAGQRDAQFKYLFLQCQANCDFDFDECRRPLARP